MRVHRLIPSHLPGHSHGQSPQPGKRGRRGRGHGSGKSQHIETFNKKCHAQNTKLSPQQPWKPEVKTPKVHQELGFFHQFHGCSHLIPLQEAAALLLPNQRNSKNLRKSLTCPFSYYIIQSLLKRIILFHYFCLFVSQTSGHLALILNYCLSKSSLVGRAE